MNCEICGSDLWQVEEKDKQCKSCLKTNCVFCNSHNIKFVLIFTSYRHFDHTGSSDSSFIGNTILCFDCGKISVLRS